MLQLEMRVQVCGFLAQVHSPTLMAGVMLPLDVAKMNFMAEKAGGQSREIS